MQLCIKPNSILLYNYAYNINNMYNNIITILTINYNYGRALHVELPNCVASCIYVHCFYRIILLCHFKCMMHALYTL